MKQNPNYFNPVNSRDEGSTRQTILTSIWGTKRAKKGKSRQEVYIFETLSLETHLLCFSTKRENKN